jgi:hypothetical protein
MDFGEVFTKAWKIIWKYKILWLFGIFASCSGGGGGGSGGGSSSGANYSGEMPPGAYHTMNNIEPWVIALIIAAMILIGVLIAIIVMAVSTVGRIGLIQGAQMADEDEEAQITFGGLFNSMKPFFWRILGLNLLIGLGAFVIIMALIFIFTFGAIFTFGLGLICILPLCCLLIPVFWVLTTFVEMANVAIVTEDLGIIDGLKRGWDVFQNNLGEMILVGLVLVLGGMVVSFIIAIPMILIMVPIMMGIFAAIFGETGAFAAGGLLISGLCCAIYLPVLIVISGIIRAYIGTAWTLTFLRLTQKGSGAILPQEPADPDPLPADVIVVNAEPVAAEETVENVPEVEAETPAADEDSLPEDF